METVTQLLQLHADLFTSMYSEGILDDHFIQIHNSLDPEDPGFLKKLADTFYQDSEKRLLDVAIELQKHEVNFRRIYEILFDFTTSGTRPIALVLVDWSSLVMRSEPATRLKTLKDDFSKLKIAQNCLLSCTLVVLNCNSGTMPQWLSGELDSYKPTLIIKMTVKGVWLEDEYFLLKRRLEAFLQLEDEILAAGGTVPIIECPGEK